MMKWLCEYKLFLNELDQENLNTGLTKQEQDDKKVMENLRFYTQITFGIKY